jgi:hypothetical protein
MVEGEEDEAVETVDVTAAGQQQRTRAPVSPTVAGGAAAALPLPAFDRVVASIEYSKLIDRTVAAARVQRVQRDTKEDPEEQETETSKDVEGEKTDGIEAATSDQSEVMSV